MNRYLAAITLIGLLAWTGQGLAMDPSESDHAHHHTALQADEVNTAHSLFHLDAAWLDQHGETVRLADFAGQPVIITMIYGACNTACPILINDARRIRAALPEEDREQTAVLVVSFDPVRDTPKAMAEYARKRSVDGGDWHFLHGEASDIRTLATLLGIRYQQRPDGDFDHSNVVAVLDGEGRIAHRSEGLMQPVDGAVAAILQ